MRKTPEANTSRLVHNCSMICGIIALIAYRTITSPTYGNPREHGFSVTRLLGAGIASAVGALIGFGIGKLLEKIRG